MGNKKKIIQSPSRIQIVDPNNFDDQYSGNVFGDNNYNMSVPTEDLCIVVELKTNTKSRTILNTSNSTNSKINVEGQKISFIDGTNNKTTGNKNYLTTQYTELSTELTELDETLGITSIDIDFNSSYAPMVNINFIDVKGGALFQPNGESKYNVLFKLPYPLFELKVKGFYGKPVTYCLHMLKCNVKFNSDTGNFEIAAQFVGYTYAMLSDMIIGYLKAAVRTKRGKELLKAKNTISINDFIRLMGNIDNLVKNQLDSNNDNVNNLAIIKELKDIILQINTSVKNTIASVSTNYQLEGASTNDSIVIVHDPVPSEGIGEAFKDYKNTRETIPSFQKEYDELIKKFNEKSGEFTELKLKEGLYPVQLIEKLNSVLAQSGVTKEVVADIKSTYKGVINTNNDNILNSIVNRLRDASSKISINDGFVKYYDFTEIVNALQDMSIKVEKQDEDTSKLVAEDLKNKLSSVLGFTPTIRNIINMLTSHIEVFLELLFEVSSKYNDTTRLLELSTFKTTPNTNSKSIDVKDTTKKDGLIYPWPEYIQNNEEKYLGSKKGPLKNPLNVPEIQFVEELYQEMVRNIEEEQDVQIVDNSVKSWPSLNPVDTIFYIDKKPYERLDSAAKPEDIARLVTLRAVGFMGFSNTLLNPDEIESFAVSEGNQIISKFRDTKFILQGLNTTFNTPAKYAEIKGMINFVESNVLKVDGQNYVYDYINENSIYRDILPLDKGFSNAQYLISDESASDFRLSSLKCDIDISGLEDTAKYLDIIDSSTYESKNVVSSLSVPDSVFVYNKLKTDSIGFLKPEELKETSFLVNNGKYGVQEFRNIDYNGTEYGVGVLDFFSLFYDNGNETTPALTRGRITTPDTSLDLGTTFKLPNNNDFADASYKNFENVGKNLNLFTLKNNQDQLAYPYMNFDLYTDTKDKVSLFTSRLYHEQNIYGKALLFLHSFPWRGLINQTDSDTFGIFKQPEILNAFQYRTGFVQVPELLPAFVGGLLWRYEKGGLSIDDIQFTSTLVDDSISPRGTDPIKFSINNISLLLNSDDNYPKTNEYIKNVGFFDTFSPMSFGSFGSYAKLEIELLRLPKLVKKRFIEEFLTFVSDTNNPNSFVNIAPLFDVTPKNGDWVSTYQTINNATIASGDNYIANLSTLQNNLILGDGENFTDRFKIFTYRYNNNSGAGSTDYYSELIQGSKADNKIKELFFGYKFIANDSWMMWNSNYLNTFGCSGKVTISKSDFEIYINKLNDVLKTKIAADEEKKFSNNENEEIKLEIYRTLKKIYDKWLGSIKSADDILFQCCSLNKTTNKDNGGRLSGDTAIKIHRGDTGALKLIDSFRFISRSFKDIGDDFQINPVSVTKMLLEGSNNSFYDIVGRILTDNNFDFIALPNFIDYNDPQELESVFEPYPYYEQDKITTTGPAFVCVYVGQTSTKLDFGKTGEYPDDSFNLTDPESYPEDLTQARQPHEDVGAAFIVRYGQQNQNIFKDIILDQSEFNETAESLQITDQIANRFSQANQTYVGQNLYNIYSIRSYKVEVEMMGDAMIQPMMYFQLDNIPMFRGAYLITKVKHSIKPNYMSTSFTGTRIKKNLTPLVDVATLYSALLDGYTLPKAQNGSSLVSTNNYVDNYYYILTSNLPKDNSGALRIIDGTTLLAPNITSTSEAELKNFDNGRIDEKDMESTISKYFETTKIGVYVGKPSTAWSSAFISYVMRSSDSNFPASQLHYDYITKAMNGKDGYEVFPLKAGLKIKAEVGDILTAPRSGGYTASHSNVIYKIENNIAYIVGGNRSIQNGGGTVKQSEIKLDAGGYITNSTDVDNAKLLTKRTVQKYYGGKELTKMQPAMAVVNTKLKTTNKNIVVIEPSAEDKEFYTAILNGIGITNPTEENYKFLYAWRQAEGASAAWNPFNTTASIANTTAYNCNRGYPVKNYPDKKSGIKATIDSLLGPKGTEKYYSKIITGLRDNLDAGIISGYIDELTTWGTGGGINKVLSQSKLNPPAIEQTTKKIASC